MAKLTNEIKQIICECIAEGSSYKQAAEYAGIAERTFYDWKSKGEKAKSGKYVHFLHALKKANAQAYMLHLKRIGKASGPTNTIKTKRTQHNPDGSKIFIEEEKQIAPVWQASAWILERRFPEDFSKHRHVETEENVPLPWSDDGSEPIDPLGEY